MGQVILKDQKVYFIYSIIQGGETFRPNKVSVRIFVFICNDRLSVKNVIVMVNFRLDM